MFLHPIGKKGNPRKQRTTPIRNSCETYSRHQKVIVINNAIQCNLLHDHISIHLVYNHNDMKYIFLQDCQKPCRRYKFCAHKLENSVMSASNLKTLLR